MRYPTPSEVVRRRHLIIAGLALCLLLVALVIQSLQAGPSPAMPGTIEVAPATPGAMTTKAPVSPVGDLTPLRPTSDPDAFARLVADAIFEWNTATLVGRAEHVEQLVAVGDPTVSPPPAWSLTSTTTCPPRRPGPSWPSTRPRSGSPSSRW